MVATHARTHEGTSCQAYPTYLVARTPPTAHSAFEQSQFGVASTHLTHKVAPKHKYSIGAVAAPGFLNQRHRKSVATLHLHHPPLIPERSHESELGVDVLGFIWRALYVGARVSDTAVDLWLWLGSGRH